MRTVSIVIPVFNGAQWLRTCLYSIVKQNFPGKLLEVSIYNDGSTDETDKICQNFKEMFEISNILLTYSSGDPAIGPRGVGFSKNRAVQQSCGKFLCFQDADDEMLADRIRLQYQAALARWKSNQYTLVGCKFRREPPWSTERYTRWANSLTPNQLHTQAFTSHGPTVVAPTWFCSRELFDYVGGFNESICKGFPEDLDFFYRLLRKGGKLFRVDHELVLYRYHDSCASFSVSEWTIWDMRMNEFQDRVLTQDSWSKFSIWNMGKQGKHCFKSLKENNKAKVMAFCDVDQRKISRGVYKFWNEKTRKVEYEIPILHHQNVVPPVVICVKQDFTQGMLEKELEKKGWIEGSDFYYLS